MLSAEVSEGREGRRGQCCETKSETAEGYVRVDFADELKSSRGHPKDANVCLAGGQKLKRLQLSVHNETSLSWIHSCEAALHVSHVCVSISKHIVTISKKLPAFTLDACEQPQCVTGNARSASLLV